ncbi:hypothetical protein [Nitrospirillum sp. BR 11828]|uniref:hypothetical protein n=1 Tax=Nitrospirillum sp. BR 11828 TaxID=3104325 RepID=UPI002ACA3A3B|nr:hypothetical protein [Nitrospirillum sp. BR 11828]MDZ5647157.1 hypothetical protein [Nitrospirillum sp. BR 11828]
MRFFGRGEGGGGGSLFTSPPVSSAGDQLGTLLAGAFAFHSDGAATFDQAMQFIQALDLRDDDLDPTAHADEQKMWRHLMQSKLRVNAGGGGIDVPVGMLLDIARGRAPSNAPAVPEEVAAREAMAAGFRLLDDGHTVAVSNTALAIQGMLKGTAWPNEWGRVLRRLPGARPGGATSFGYQGSTARVTLVPLD